MTAALDMSASTDTADRALRRSPGLGQFRKSPFRLLRLAPTATAKQAVWQCNKALARARVGQPLPDPDPVPWLPGGDEIELQEAAQTMESPLARIVEQLLWFDAAGDPAGATVIDALIAADAARLRGYLATPGATIAQRINQANLRLLLGLSRLHGVGPSLARGEAAPVTTLAWKSEAGLTRALDPHKAIRSAGVLLDGHIAWAETVGAGVVAWGELLADGEMAAHVHDVITALGDELLTSDDIEAVLSGVRTRIADMIVGETKLEISDGRLDNVGQLAAIAGRSKIDAETWLVAFRPLKTQFQLELADLAPDAETGLGVVEDVSAYLDRLATVRARWKPIDEAQLLGLSELIDDALSTAFGRLRGESRATQLSTRFSDVLDQINNLTASPSFKERIRGYRERLVDVSKAMCHFCGTQEREVDFCAAVSSRVETHRERIYNGYRIHYKVGAMPISRCKGCALRHGFLRGVGFSAFTVMATSILLIALVHPTSWFHSIDAVAGGFFVVLLLGLAIGLAYMARSIIAGKITPPDHRRYSEYLSTHAVESLRGDGFSDFKYDYRVNAWELVTKQGVANHHNGGDLGKALKTLFWIALAIGYVILRLSH